MGARGALAPVDVQGLLAARKAGLMPTSPTGEISAVQPTLYDMLVGEPYSSLLTALGADQRTAAGMRNDLKSLMDFLPVAGEAMGAEEAGRSLGGGDYLSGGAGLAMSMIPGGKQLKNLTLREIKEIVAGRPIFARWSRGPDFDMKPGAVSKDYVSGASHDGLSAISVSPDASPSQMLRELRDYSFLRAKDSKIRPHIYAGEQVGRDSDGAPSIRPSEYLGSLSDDIVSALDDDAFLERMSLMEQIDQGQRALEYFKKNPPDQRFIQYWTDQKVDELRSRLAGLGGPIGDL